MLPGTYNFEIVRGTTQPLVVNFQTPIADTDPVEYTPIPMTQVRLAIKRGSSQEEADYLRLASGDDANLTLVDGLMTWTPTAAESRSLFPTGADGIAKNTYEIECWNGPTSQRVYVFGSISAIGGLNDDS